MEDTQGIPARPWGEKEIAFLKVNQYLLTEEERAELGLVPPVADNNFRANTDINVVAKKEEKVKAPVEKLDTSKQK